MATTKKAAKAAEKETKVEKAAEKVTKAAEKAVKTTKTAAKAVEEKAEKAVKKAAPKKPAETKVNFFVEFGGVQVSIDEVIANVKDSYGKDAKEIAVYLKPEESKAYFVADGEEKEMDVFFC